MAASSRHKMRLIETIHSLGPGFYRVELPAYVVAFN